MLGRSCRTASRSIRASALCGVLVRVMRQSGTNPSAEGLIFTGSTSAFAAFVCMFADRLLLCANVYAFIRVGFSYESDVLAPR